MSPERSVEAAYDAFAQTYDENRASFDISSVLVGFQARLPQTGALLDIGCGAGEPVAKDFLSHGWHVTGVDVSDAMLDLARRHIPQATLFKRDIREIDFAPNTFDAVTATYSLFHIPWTDHSIVFHKIKAWLRPGGLALFTYATSAYTGSEEFNGYLDFMGQRLFYSHTTIDGLHEQLSAAGLEVVDEQDRLVGGETFRWFTVRG